MARLLTDGAERGDSLRLNYSADGGAGTGIRSDRKRTGNYSYGIGDGTGGMVGWNITSNSEFYARVGYGFSLSPGAAIIIQWLSDTNNAGYLKLKSYGIGNTVFEMYDGSNLRATSSTVSCTSGTYETHVLEVYVKLAANPNGRFTLKFDGSQILDFTGATNTYSTVNRFYCKCAGGGGGCFVDDIAVNDTTGGVDNSWVGDGGVLGGLVPSGTGNYSDLTASTGNAWDCVNELPGSMSDYIYSSTVDQKSSFAMTDLSGLPAGASISRVWTELLALESAAEGGKIATLLRSGSTDDVGSDQTLTLAAARYTSSEYLTDPADAAAWNSTKVNALEAGAKVR